MTQSPIRPRVALTLGDPAGIGPELAVRLLADQGNLDAAEIYVLADKSEVMAACAAANVEVGFADAPEPGKAVILDDASAPAEPIPTGVVSAEAGARALHQLRRAMALANAGEVDALVFAPLNKTSLHLGGMQEQDELRWFAKELKHEGLTSEINILGPLWTARVTSHIAIKNVAAGVTSDNVLAAVRLLHELLYNFGIDQPRLAIAALNPHGGENGHFGREEIDEIVPGVARAREEGITVEGPFPADTIFLTRDNYDGIVTQYHDQGQIAMKLLGFDGGVTVQGGLPLIVATPAHGTAFELVGTGKANLTSSQNALDTAIAIARRRAERLQ